MPSSYLKSQIKGYIQEPQIREELEAMAQDITFRTVPGYSIDSEQYPDNSIPFVEEHLHYLKKHPKVNPQHYLSNLRLMLKKR